MLYPTIFNDSLFDDLMDFSFPMVRGLEDADRKLYGKNAGRVMKTDVREHDEGYEVDIDLPGFKKDEITLNLENGYLTVSAAKGLDKEEKDKKGKLIRQERWSGSMQRSFFVGRNVTEEEIKAKFEDGVLKLSVPKKDPNKLPERKTIMIEG
ncbi:MAG: Hsp20/alpha crystallin family protein [Clostridiales bacterium]|nr:Hsp20/alpha crystallin family protein [Clostridiales bacterium]